jgi:hypothetical protein
MSFDPRRAVVASFDVAVPLVPLSAIRERGVRLKKRETTRWKSVAAALAFVSAFTLTLVFERHAAPPHAPAPMASTTPAPAIT